jgi:hypothetical protein
MARKQAPSTMAFPALRARALLYSRVTPRAFPGNLHEHAQLQPLRQPLRILANGQIAITMYLVIELRTV